MKIGIIGLGAVGKANQFGFEKIGHQVLRHDIKLNTKIQDVLEAKVIFICVPTPSKHNGSCDTSIVEDVINKLTKLNFKGAICIRSSTEPGFTDKIIKKYKNKKICFVPEFLRERCAKKDFVYNHNLLAVGTHDRKVFYLIKKTHGKLPKNTIKLRPTEAEILKY